MASGVSVAAVVVTYDALPWIEQCLDSLVGVETVVVDNGSSDETVAFVRERYPDVRVIEAENRGLAAGWNIGIGETDEPLRAPAERGRVALGRRSRPARELRGHAPADGGRRSPSPESGRDAAALGARGFRARGGSRPSTSSSASSPRAPRRSTRSTRAASTTTRCATVEVVMGACMLVRREAIDEVGHCDEDYFLFSEETDWCYRFREAGWEVVFFPGAECIHVRGASHSGRLYRENLRGHLLFLCEAPRAEGRPSGRAACCSLSLRLRGLVFRGERGRAYRDGAAWLASGDAATLLERVRP